MGDDDDGLAAAAQVRQELAIKDVLVLRVLVRGPFVEDKDGTILEIRGDERQALALALRQIGRRELLAAHLDLAVHLQQLQVVARGRFEVGGIQAQELAEQMAIGEHHRESFAVSASVAIVHRRAVHQQLAVLR